MSQGADYAARTYTAAHMCGLPHCKNEGAAVAHICARYGVPMIEIRGISNLTGERDMKKWNIPLAVSNCNKAVSELVRRLS